MEYNILEQRHTTAREMDRPNDSTRPCLPIAMLRTLPEEKKSNWADSLNKVVHAYNCTRNDATGFAPFFLLFGRAPRLPIDQIFGLCHLSQSVIYPKYVEQWATAMKDAYEIVRKRTGHQLHTRGERERKRALMETFLTKVLIW